VRSTSQPLVFLLHFVNYNTEDGLIRPSAGDLPIRFTFEWTILMYFNSLPDGLLLFYIRKSATRTCLTNTFLPHWSLLMLLECFQWTDPLGKNGLSLFSKHLRNTDRTHSTQSFQHKYLKTYCDLNQINGVDLGTECVGDKRNSHRVFWGEMCVKDAFGNA